MKRIVFLQLLCAGIMTVSTATPMEAVASIMPFSVPQGISVAPEPGVATAEDMDSAKVEKAYYGHWRRVHRRVYRRHYYYHHPYRYYHPYHYHHYYRPYYHPYHRYYHRRYY